MAKYNVNHTTTQRMKEKFSDVVSPKKTPVVVPTDKLEIARLKAKKAQDKNNYFIATILILIGALLWKVLT